MSIPVILSQAEQIQKTVTTQEQYETVTGSLKIIAIDIEQSQVSISYVAEHIEGIKVCNKVSSVDLQSEDAVNFIDAILNLFNIVRSV
jgi:hypothetical protein